MRASAAEYLQPGEPIRENLRIHRRFFKDIQAADSALTQVHPGEPAQVDEPRPVRPR
jgi:hypothetical protein